MAPLPLGQGHVKAEGEGVEPSRLIARPLSKRVPSPIGLPFRSNKLRQEESNVHPLLNRQVDYRYRTPDRVRTAGFEPAISCSRSTRQYQAFLRPVQQERPAVAKCALLPWQSSRLPLHHGRLVGSRIVKDREHREGLEPSSPHYGCGVLATGRPVQCFSMGPKGLEPSPDGLRVQFASGSPENRTQHYAVISRVWATCPRLPSWLTRSGRWDSNPQSRVPKTRGLAAALHSAEVRTVGFEPTISWPPATRDTRLRYVLFDASAYGERKVDQGAIESPSPGFQPGATAVSATGPSSCMKKARCRCDTGLWWSTRIVAKCHKRRGCPGSTFAG